jgi:uncharacterized membrane-anchored protein
MQKTLLFTFLLVAFLPGFLTAQTTAGQSVIDSINNSFTYKTGTIDLNDGMAKLKVPKGFKYLDPTQSQRLIVDIWGNPPGITTQGMLFPVNGGPLGKQSWGFNVTYDDMGFVSDGDADEIDYDELLGSMQEGTETENEERAKQGYDPITLVGWASTPFYDKEHKVLHWAQELKFGDSTAINTVNYDVRVLGRKGVMSMNAIGTMDDIKDIKASIPGIIDGIAFEPGNRYGDFTTGDKLAAVTIGGLVAGKVLAKVGMFALLLKFWKVILVAVAGGWSFVRRFLTGKNKPDVEPSGEVS